MIPDTKGNGEKIGKAPSWSGAHELKSWKKHAETQEQIRHRHETHKESSLFKDQTYCRRAKGQRWNDTAFEQ